MFDLNRSVKALAARACGNWFARRVHQSEIEDYLFCVVEENVRTGLDEQQAFEQARLRMGEATAIRAQLKRARKSLVPLRYVIAVAVVTLAVAGVVWQQSEISRQTATDLLAVVVRPLRWLGLVT
jgi:hypothetical protein